MPGERSKSYSEKRSFDKTPEPAPESEGNVDPGRAVPGTTFVIHQHHARRLHFDLRLEMMNGNVPVLVSWAVPKNLPRRPGDKHLAVHVEDHPFDYSSFEGTIPEGNYGAGEVRIFDRGTYEVMEQEPGKLTVRLRGDRVAGEYHMFQTGSKDRDPNDWLVFLGKDLRSEPDPLPEPIPMLATLDREPFDDDRYLFEVKWDGVRALAVCTDETMLLSRKRSDITATYPELARMHERLVAYDAILDGEIVAFEGARPSFEKLQSRINLQNAKDIEKAAGKIPVQYIAFDLLYLDGRSLIGRPVEERRELLEGLVVPGERISVSEAVHGDGIALFEATKEARLEGIVAKRLGSPYRPGKRTREWIKVKAVHEADLVIGGWSRGEGSRSGSFGALLMGAYEGDELRFVGAVGTGFSEKTIDQVLGALKTIETVDSPFAGGIEAVRAGRFGKPIKDPHWVEPLALARVEFRELTSADRLRAPSFKGVSFDRDPAEATLSELRTIAGIEQG